MQLWTFLPVGADVLNGCFFSQESTRKNLQGQGDFIYTLFLIFLNTYSLLESEWPRHFFSVMPEPFYISTI